ncbi:MAG: RNA 2',3'-cyclic phosphodiesterase [Candidatus Omnitrophota bacterium]
MLPAIRTFIAIEIDERIQRELARIQDRLKTADPETKLADPRIRWTNPKNLHLTLNFLGDIEPKIIDTIEKILSETAKDFNMFHMNIGTLGAFPNMHEPDIIWAGINKRANLLTDIALKLEERLTAHGITPAEHRFTPHITLGRSKNEASCQRLSDLLNNTHLPAGLSQKVDRICLFRSELLPKGPVYHLLFTAHLNKQ